jgi:signal transduction histidine kinase
MKVLSQLRWQLMLSYLPLIIIPVLLVGLVTRSVAEQGVTLLVSQGAQEQAHLFSPCFAEYYEAHGSWDGLSSLLKPPAPGRTFGTSRRDDTVHPEVNIMVSRNRIFDFYLKCYSAPASIPAGVIQMIQRANFGQVRTGSANDVADNPTPSALPRSSYALSGFKDIFRPSQMLVTDVNGVVIASNNSDVSVGQTIAPSVLARGAPIMVNNQLVGMLVVGAALDALEQQQRQLLDGVNFALLVSGAVSVVLAVGLAWGMSGRITIPVRQLMAGVKRLSTGEWSAPLEVRSQNEFGELTHAFNAMASEVTRQQQLNRQMVADIAHDLRTPLSAMALEIEAIEAGFQTPAEATASLREEINWLQRLVDDLRLLSLMDADQIRLQLEPTPLYPFLCGVMDFWQIMVNEEGRCLVLDADPTLPAALLEPGRMRQVLGNLIDNAIRHTKPGGTITISAQADTSGATLRIADDGEGIAPDDLPHVFDRFYRADPSRAHTRSGSGLGLSISRRLVEMHGGTIEVQSTVGQGTTFTIHLPLKPAETREVKRWPRPAEGRYLPAT